MQPSHTFQYPKVTPVGGPSKPATGSDSGKPAARPPA
jgi:hypothetical protein